MLTGSLQYLKNQIALEKHHPELVNIWGSLESDMAIIKPTQAPQPSGIAMKLLPFQLEGLYWMKQQEKGPWKGGMRQSTHLLLGVSKLTSVIASG